MPNYSANDAVVISTPHVSKDIFIIPLTSKTDSLLPGEFVLENWNSAGLNVVKTIKRGIYTVHEKLVIKKVGSLSEKDAEALKISLTSWIEMS